MTKFVIIGAGEAGTRAALNLNGEGDVTLISEEPHWPYERPPLSKPGDTGLVIKEIATQEALSHVTFKRGVPATTIDRAGKRVILSDGEAVDYDKLLLATGATPRALPCPGGEYAFALRRFDEAQKIYARSAIAKTAVIIGAGLIGLELAAVLCSHGLEVTVLEAGSRALGRALSPDLASFLVSRHEQEGVTFRFDTQISHLTEDAVHLVGGELFIADLIIAAIGVTPNTILAANSGLQCSNGICVDCTLKTTDPEIFAAGDCANLAHPKFGPIRFEAWRVAVEMGAAAAAAMAGNKSVFAPLPWFWSDQYSLGLQMVGRHDQAHTCVTRNISSGVLNFELGIDGQLVAAAGIALGNAVAKDIKIAERMITAGICPAPEMLADPDHSMKKLLRSM